MTYEVHPDVVLCLGAFFFLVTIVFVITLCAVIVKSVFLSSPAP